jgi:ABC-2 type transport system ATP-binding protein
MDEAEHCESLAFIYFGQIIAHGAPHTIVAEALPEFVLAIESGDPVKSMQLVRRMRGAGRIDAHGISLFGAEVHVNVADPERSRSVLAAEGIAEAQMHVTSPSLEDAFIALVEQADNGKPSPA